MNKLNELIIKVKKGWLIGRKISLSIVILILIFIVIIAVQILGLQKLNNTIQTNNVKFNHAVHVKEAEKIFSLFQLSLTERQQEGSDYISKLDGIFEGYKISIFRKIEIVEKDTDNDGIKKIIDNLKKTFPEFFQLSKKYILMSRTKNTLEAEKLELEKKMLGNNIYDDLSNINNILSTEQTENAKMSERRVIIILWIAIISATVGTIIGGAFAFLLTFHINKGIKNLLKNTSESISYIMDGDFASRIDPDKISLPDFTTILKQINNLVDAFTLPMTTAAGHIAVIAKGAIPPLMSGDFKGDFMNLANNVNSLTNAMIKINEVAENIARGNLNIAIEPRSEEDIILKSMQLSINNLSEFAVSVQTASGQVAIGSQEMSEGAQRMALSSSQQAASIEEISSSIEEINSSISQNADNAGETANISEKTASDAEKGGNAVKNTVEAMKSIAENISVIEVIADQTNMLALNAAIEAARAGESGKGFAVVANAIRNLAGRSSDAAKQISELTGSSLKVADEAGQLIEKIVPEIKRTSGLIQEINSSNLEQAKGIDQISKAVEHLENEIQQNASSTEEMAATSEQLSSQADRLKEIALFFNIKNNI